MHKQAAWIALVFAFGAWIVFELCGCTAVDYLPPSDAGTMTDADPCIVKCQFYFGDAGCAARCGR